ncbi:MAG: hypothetical protein KAU62_04050 [Candidatus Heimdallarchaeota archaeon]|nr:hypothetical protein [Candidatus Heimdallarchaeota archaeon]MCK4610309.1 hypothetical protein [Candidatus Heimdallarchaeota archaeon]
MSNEIRTRIDDDLQEKLIVVKKHCGLKNDSELVRLLVSEKYNKIIVKEQLTPVVVINEKIDALFYQGFFDEFLEELAEKEPKLFDEYTKQQSKPREPQEEST